MKLPTFALCIFFNFSTLYCSSTFQQLVQQLDPTPNIIELALERGVEPGSGFFDYFLEKALRDNDELYRLLYLELPYELASYSSYQEAVQERILGVESLEGDNLIVVLITAIRHRDHQLFQEILGIAADNISRIPGGELYERFVFEITSPQTPPFYFRAYLEAIPKGCDRGLMLHLKDRMNIINHKHKEIFENMCKKAIEADRELNLAPSEQQSKEFFEIVELNKDMELEPDSNISKMSLENDIEVVYSIAGTVARPELAPEMTVEQVIETFKHFSTPSVELAAFIVDKASNKGILLKTPGTSGPFFAVFGCVEEDLECPLILQSQELFLVHDKPGTVHSRTFDIQPNQFFIGVPKNYERIGGPTLLTDAAWWFNDRPENGAVMLTPFIGKFELTESCRTSVVYSFLITPPNAGNIDVVMGQTSAVDAESAASSVHEKGESESSSSSSGKEPEEPSSSSGKELAIDAGESESSSLANEKEAIETGPVYQDPQYYPSYQPQAYYPAYSPESYQEPYYSGSSYYGSADPVYNPYPPFANVPYYGGYQQDQGGDDFDYNPAHFEQNDGFEEYNPEDFI